MISIAVNNPRTSYFVGGAEMVSIEHAKQLANLGFTVAFYTIHPKSIGENYSKQYLYFKNKFKNMIKFYEINQDETVLPIYKIQPGEDRKRWNIESLSYGRQLAFELTTKSAKYDIMLSYFNLDAISISRSNVERNIIYLCGVPQTEDMFRTSILTMYDKIITITDETKHYWEKYTDQVISVIPTGVDETRFTPALKNDQKIKIISIGRLIERKGCHLLLTAISSLPIEALNKIEVLIIGDGPQHLRLQLQIKETGLDQYVKMIGRVDNPELYLSKADICVFPSLAGEGLQGAILEAMSSEAAIIASNSSINKTLLADGRGILIDSNDCENISKALLKLINNPGLRLSIGARSRAYVIEKYSWIDLIRKLIKKIGE